MRLSILVRGLQPWNALHWRLLPSVTISRGRSLGGRVFRGWSLGTGISIRTACRITPGQPPHPACRPPSTPCQGEKGHGKRLRRLSRSGRMRLLRRRLCGMRSRDRLAYAVVFEVECKERFCPLRRFALRPFKTDSTVGTWIYGSQ